LDYTVKDAMDFAAVLRDPNFGRFTDGREYFQVLTDEQATLSNILAAINNIAQRADRDDLVVLYFASHGSDAGMDAAVEGMQTGYIITYDTNLNNLFGTALSMENLQNIVNRFRAERVVAFLDTCYSGDTVNRSKAAGGAVSPNNAGTSVAQARRGARVLSMSDGETAAETQSGSRALAITHDGTGTEAQAISGARAHVYFDEAARVAQGRGRIVIASSQNDEMSWESDSYANGYFTFYLMEAMRQQNGLKNVTQLFNSLRGNVLTAVKRDKGETQTPVIDPEGREISIVIGTAVQ